MREKIEDTLRECRRLRQRFLYLEILGFLVYLLLLVLSYYLVKMQDIHIWILRCIRIVVAGLILLLFIKGELFQRRVRIYRKKLRYRRFVLEDFYE